MSGPLSANWREANNSKPSTGPPVRPVLILQLDAICHPERPRAPGAIFLYPPFGGLFDFHLLTCQFESFQGHTLDRLAYIMCFWN